MSRNRQIFCIVPPHILNEIARNGTASQKDMAIHTIISSERERSHRGGSREAASKKSAVVKGNKQRTIYNAQHDSKLPGIKVRSEGGPLSSLTVNEAYDGSGSTYDFYFNVFGRKSVDNNGLRLDSSIHYRKGYDNAFWNGRQMVYGDGDENLPPDQRLFNRFTSSLDIIGHELTHGVIQYEANLDYHNQAGALNDSISDVFGSLIRQYQRRETADKADWIIGADLLTSNVKGVGIRSMKAPGSAYDDPVLGKDPQPMHMNQYVNTLEDDGGVHINSGIPNHAFYVVAREIGSYAWEKAGAIWYKVLTEKLKSDSNFIDAANLTYQAAAELFGSGSLEQKAVQLGWAAVGITVGAAVVSSSTPKGSIQ